MMKNSTNKKRANMGLMQAGLFDYLEQAKKDKRRAIFEAIADGLAFIALLVILYFMLLFGHAFGLT
jgi:hypothetical protein